MSKFVPSTSKCPVSSAFEEKYWHPARFPRSFLRNAEIKVKYSTCLFTVPSFILLTYSFTHTNDFCQVQNLLLKKKNLFLICVNFILIIIVIILWCFVSVTLPWWFFLQTSCRIAVKKINLNSRMKYDRVDSGSREDCMMYYYLFFFGCSHHVRLEVLLWPSIVIFIFNITF